MLVRGTRYLSSRREYDTHEGVRTPGSTLFPLHCKGLVTDLNMPMAPSQLSVKDTILSRGHIEGLIAQGRKIVIVDGMVLKVDAWMPFHPGGDKAILHMVGRDASDEVTVYVLLILRFPMATKRAQIALFRS